MDQRRVLLVDDTEIMLRLEKTFLTRRAFEISIARNGAEGLAKARSLKPHLIVVDLHLPDLDGDALCRQLKGDPETRDVAIIIVTTARDRNSRDRSLLSGCDGFLTKPLNQDSFCRMVENLLGVSMRVHRRVQAELHCEVRTIGLRIASTLLDLSEGGAFVSPAGMLPDVDVLDLHFCLPGTPDALSIPSRVCWSDREGVNGRRGVGVRFLDLSPEAAVRLRTYIAVRTGDAALAHERSTVACSAKGVDERHRAV